MSTISESYLKCVTTTVCQRRLASSHVDILLEKAF